MTCGIQKCGTRDMRNVGVVLKAPATVLHLARASCAIFHLVSRILKAIKKDQQIVEYVSEPAQQGKGKKTFN